MLFVGRLDAGAEVVVPDAAHVHVFVAIGDALLDGARLATGDAARLTDAGTRALVAGAGGTEVLVWVTA